MGSGHWRVQAFTHVLRAPGGRPEDASDFIARANEGASEVGALGKLSLALADAGLPVDSIVAARRAAAAYSQPRRDSSGDPDGGLSDAAQALNGAFDEASRAIGQFNAAVTKWPAG
jgi:hypothetical protein